MESVTVFRSQPRSEIVPANLSRGLGWFSVALGLTEIASPDMLSRVIGIRPKPSTSWLQRAMGVRELLAGAGVLMQPRGAAPLWTRVAGDVVDLGLLALASRTKRGSGARLAGAVAAVAGVTALDVIAARRAQRVLAKASRPAIFSVTINKPPAEVYAFFRKLAQLPLFMDYLESVHEIDHERSHWVARLPIGGTIAWDAKITEDRPGEALAWQSAEGSLINTRGRVTFARAPGRDMTEVRVEMQLGVRGTEPSAGVARLFARSQIKGDLRRLKQVLETGEVLVSDASAHRRPHAAQPPAPGDKLQRHELPFIESPPTAVKGKLAGQTKTDAGQGNISQKGVRQ
jgi:uncharacterized membrane protein